ncbi:hypothetical protein WDJ51_08435 [Rathayibacter sp. YIM 133350]|uniref:hypothetical protein n=1 Tax=Rathayibacter sp. YIM 133350 TaxID=3131992 RepID=UPI00307D5043
MNLIEGSTDDNVPFVARAASRPNAPVIAVWHLMDPPATPAAMAAALPLAGLDASVVYLGLPLTGARAVYADFEQMLASGTDMVTDFFGPMHEQALAEYPQAIADVRRRLGVTDAAPLGLLGGSAGASIAAEVLTTHGATAAVLVNPMLRLRPMIDATAPFLPEPYAWTPAADAIAERMDFIARAPELAASGAPILLIEGGSDEPAFLDATREFETLGIGEVRYVEGVEHPLAEWPGLEPAPQIEAAKTYDRLAVEFFTKAFSG